ncbi:Lrp/AsnC family transcriptional regulator [Candidatus Woesearchaeota archaeon]|nr:Lrp/AsnC family transcriptional regulator [Candidatus Woesearchaeota archaeon]
MLDKKDWMILEVLKHSSNLSTQKISRITKIPITTIHHRIKKLEKSGVIREYTVLLDNKKIGKPIAAYVLIAVDYKLLQQQKTTQYDLIKKLKGHPNVEETAIITGSSDIVVKVRFSDIEHLDEFVTKYLRNVKGVEKTQTSVVLNEA